MKIITASDNKKIIKMSKSEWKTIGKIAGWTKKSQLISDFDELTLGPTPSDEPCAQVGWDNYMELTKMEIKAFIEQLKRTFPPQEGAMFVAKRNPYDFGTYYEVAVKYDENNEKAVEYAFNIESHTPEHWDQQARDELESKGYFKLLEASKGKLSQ